MSRQLYLLFFAVVIGCSSCSHPGANNQQRSSDIPSFEYDPIRIHTLVTSLEMLLQEGSYIRFNEKYALFRSFLPDKYRLYFDIIHCDLFGYPELLEAQDKELRRKYYMELTEGEKIYYHFTKISHYQKKYAYNQAFAEVLKLEQFSERLDPITLADLQQYHERFSVLLHTPPVAVTKHPGDTIHMEKIRGHYYIPVSINGNRMKMVFDTGAGWSVISRSLAEKFGLNIFETKTEVLGFTGAKSASNLGVARQMTVGNTLLEHVVFEVVEDSLLGVPEYELFFDGLVGMDLLYPMGSVSINAPDVLTINENSDHEGQVRMSLDHFSNRFAVKFQDQVLPVKLDSGAWMSIFSWRFYDLFKTSYLNNCIIQTKEFGGIGGTKSQFDMVHLNSMLVFVERDSFLLEDAWVHTKSIHKDPVTYFGLMGQDFIEQFDEITLNFKPNSIAYFSQN